MDNNFKIEIGTIVSFNSKKQEKKGKIVKVYDENNKTYYKILSEKKYYYKQLKNLSVCI